MIVEVRDLPARFFVGPREKVTPRDFGPFLHRAFQTTLAELTKRGISPSSAPGGLYHEHLPAEGVFDFQGGFFVSEAVEAPGLHCEALSEGRAAMCVHTGDYQRLGETHDAMRHWLEKHGHPVLFPSWELFTTDPGQTPPGKNQTEVWYRLDP